MSQGERLLCAASRGSPARLLDSQKSGRDRPMNKQYSLVSACFGLASRRPGAVRGPSALCDAGLIARMKAIGIDIHDTGMLTEPSRHEIKDPHKKHLPEVLEFSSKLIETLRVVYQQNRTPILVGGDHSISISSVSAAAEYARQQQRGDIGLLWVDAHADINTPDTSPSGNIHGMSVAHLLGLGDPSLTHLCGFAPKLAPHNIVYLGLRDLDPCEGPLLKKLGIGAYTMHDIDRRGIGTVCEEIFSHLRRLGGFIVSFDLDVCDPVVAPGVGTPVRGGLTYRESHLIMEMAAELPNLLSVELVEYNPDTDMQGATAEFALGLLESAMGKRIL